MNLVKILELFDNNPEYIVTKHFKERLIERGLSLDLIMPIVKNNVLGIYNQFDNKYKLILSFDSNYDLILIADININTKAITFITIYKEDINKRLRKDGY